MVETLHPGPAACGRSSEQDHGERLSLTVCVPAQRLPWTASEPPSLERLIVKSFSQALLLVTFAILKTHF